MARWDETAVALGRLRDLAMVQSGVASDTEAFPLGSRARRRPGGDSSPSESCCWMDVNAQLRPSVRPRDGALLLARHGATEANLEGIRIGLSAVPLAPRGRAQAERLAERVRAMPLEAVWTSPLVRACETAEIVAARCDLPLRISAELREMDVGPLEGLREEEIARRFPEEKRAWSGEPTVAPPGAESLAVVAERVVTALERIRTKEFALCITHLTPMRLAWAHYGRHPIGVAPSFFPDHCALHALGPKGLEPREG